MKKTVSVLFSEGSSLSARQALSALGPLGYRIDVCDPNLACICRFSRFVRRFHRSPSCGKDPAAYLRFIVGLLKGGRYDVLLPVHEQAFLFARTQRTLCTLVGLALPFFDCLAMLQSKASSSQLLSRLGLPQPATHLVSGRAGLEAKDAFPFYIKLPYSTAGQGVRRVNNVAERTAVISELERAGVLDGPDEVVIQSAAQGVQCQAQAVYEHGTLLAVHCTSQRSVGMGGSQSARLGVDHPVVRSHLSVLGQYLGWHGALAVDYFFDPATGQPVYFEANPRLVEPMNAVLSGVNLADLLVRLSLGESFKSQGVRIGRPGVRTHSLLATLLGLAAEHGSRTCIAREVVRAMFGRGVYAGSKEDLTPFVRDPPSLMPLAVVLARVLFHPASAQRLSARTVADYSLTPGAIREILQMRDDEGVVSAGLLPEV